VNILEDLGARKIKGIENKNNNDYTFQSCFCTNLFLTLRDMTKIWDEKILLRHNDSK
jgi:hypothetical protein